MGSSHVFRHLCNQVKGICGSQRPICEPNVGRHSPLMDNRLLEMLCLIGEIQRLIMYIPRQIHALEPCCQAFDDFQVRSRRLGEMPNYLQTQHRIERQLMMIFDICLSHFGAGVSHLLGLLFPSCWMETQQERNLVGPTPAKFRSITSIHSWSTESQEEPFGGVPSLSEGVELQLFISRSG